ncbi:hypothetical protein Si116_00874 [Streptococcus infantarius subsp. infantarius]|nr:hypothetical protein [Streptococcus infantarius subsp. infantarius]MCO4492149.1 hypothetical protein [Streptococcus infantarius subsp. infantarius]MCO4510572.1 hypothetical protein [Streptococcus infantarius subsp. infantarius]
MNKQELIKKINDLDEITINVQTDDGPVGISYFRKPEVLELVKQIEKPEKPVVPRCVADMIVKRKRAGQNVVKAIENLRFYEDACKWVRNNGEAFVKAWLYGYEVEKEQLYTVEIPNPNEPDSGHIVLHKDEHNKVYIDWHYEDDWKLLKSLKLTEAEIKKDFEWAWQFAEEVEE